MSPRPIGNARLAKAAGVEGSFLRRACYVAQGRERETAIQVEEGLTRTERTYPLIYEPDPALGVLGHIAFSIKHEVPHLGLMQKALAAIAPAVIADYVQASPTGAFAKKIGYFYELLTGRTVPLPHAFRMGGGFVELMDPLKVVTSEPLRSARWRVDDNLLGGSEYCPTIERTAKAQAAIAPKWGEDVRLAIGATADGTELMRRALSYLYLKETRSSFRIEREEPSSDRAERFVAALHQGGVLAVEETLSEKRLVELQGKIVDPRFAAVAFRTDQNYVSQTVRWDEVIHYVCPPPSIVGDLMAGLAHCGVRMNHSEPLAQATAVAFGFVFIHPFNDGNGRIHRYLLHDILARRHVLPSGVALPLSSAILEDMRSYDATLEAYSAPLRQVVSYELNPDGSLAVKNGRDAEWYWRYPDLTPQVEYVGRVMRRSIAMVPEEVEFMRRHDDLREQAKAVLDMPDIRLAELLARIHENNGTLSKNKQKQRFSDLADEEIARIEGIYAEVFGDRVEAEQKPLSRPPRIA